MAKFFGMILITMHAQQLCWYRFNWGMYCMFLLLLYSVTDAAVIRDCQSTVTVVYKQRLASLGHDPVECTCPHLYHVITAHELSLIQVLTYLVKVLGVSHPCYVWTTLLDCKLKDIVALPSGASTWKARNVYSHFVSLVRVGVNASLLMGEVWLALPSSLDWGSMRCDIQDALQCSGTV